MFLSTSYLYDISPSRPSTPLLEEPNEDSENEVQSVCSPTDISEQHIVNGEFSVKLRKRTRNLSDKHTEDCYSKDDSSCPFEGERRNRNKRVQSCDIKVYPKALLKRCDTRDRITDSAGVVFGYRKVEEADNRNKKLVLCDETLEDQNKEIILEFERDQQRSKIRRMVSPSLENAEDMKLEPQNQRCHDTVKPTIDTNEEETIYEQNPISEGETKEDAPEPVVTPNECPDDMDPDAYVKLIIQSQMGFLPQVRNSLSVPNDFFPKPTDEQLAAYTNEVIEAIREQKIDVLRSMISSGSSLHCCNRFGESILHTACRRGFTDVVALLVNEAKVTIRVRDDYGRTPLHDACWNREPAFEIMDILIKNEPALILMTDKRGFTPFQYARREHWGLWRNFLYERRDYFRMEADVAKLLQEC